MINEDHKNSMVTQISSSKKNAQLFSSPKKPKANSKFLLSDSTFKIMFEEVLENLRKEKKNKKKKPT